MPRLLPFADKLLKQFVFFPSSGQPPASRCLRPMSNVRRRKSCIACPESSAAVRCISERPIPTDQKNTLMIGKPQIVQTDAQLTAIIHLAIPRKEIRNVIGPGINELMATIAAQGTAPAGPWFDHHLKMDPEIFEFEI